MAVDLHDVNCPGCGAPMDGHLCPSSSGSGTPTVVREYVRGTGPRKVATAHPTCPHCEGRIHFNMGATAINAECLWRKYLVETRVITVADKLPEMMLSGMLNMAAWYEEEIKKGKTFSYGKQGGGTYSTRRKTPVLTPTSTAPAFPPPTAPDPTATPLSPSKVEALMKEELKKAAEKLGLAPKKEPTKEELRAKRREMMAARAKK